MNPDTGHLIKLQEGVPIPEIYEEVPPHLNRAAKRKLNGNSEAYVSLTSGSKLSDWAKQKRKNKTIKQSKKKNRWK